MGELPKIISVDDHVVEPPHVWQEYLPARFKADGPRVERRGIGHMAHIGGADLQHDELLGGVPLLVRQTVEAAVVADGFCGITRFSFSPFSLRAVEALI